MKMNFTTLKFILLLSLTLLFTKPIIKLWGLYVKPGLSYLLGTSLINDAACLLLLYLFVLVALDSEVRLRLKKSLELIVFYIAFLLLLFRVFQPQNFGGAFSFTPFFLYFDVFFVLVICYFLKRCGGFKEKKIEVVSSGFKYFGPVRNLDDDKLDYRYYAEKLANEIINTSTDQAFSIGITGRWGSGKTSFSNLLDCQLKQHKDIICITFKPWVNADPKRLLNDFFNSLRNQLGDYSVEVNSALIEYKRMLFDAPFFLDFLKPILDVKDHTINTEFDKLCRLINSLNKKIVVFIDDLDRLSPEESLDIFKLIRNTANFPNVFYIVNYDRVYILNSLAKIGINNPGMYLEKMFPLEVNLPMSDNLYLKQYLIDGLKTVYPADLHSLLDSEIGNESNFSNSYIANSLLNLRDVNRFLCSLGLNVKEIVNEVHVHDLLRIEILRLKFPEIYELLVTNRYALIEQRNINDIGCYVSTESKIAECYLLKDLKESGCYQEATINRIKYLLLGLFQENKINTLEKIRGAENSIIYPSKYDRYFSYKMKAGEFSTYRFSVALY